MTVIIRWAEQQERAESHIKVPTPIGYLIVYHIDNVITKTEWNLEYSVINTIVEGDFFTQIQDYFNNPTNALTVTLQKQGSCFRNKVWAEICKIPVGQVLSYSELARKVGSGSRAVANACRDNPFPGIIPCHRVVSMTGLGGYMGKTSGKLFDIKKALLLSESALN